MNIKEELLSSIARFNNVVNSSPDAIVLTNCEAVIQFVNPAAEVMFGRTRENLVGMPFHFSDRSEQTIEIEVLQAGSAPLTAEMRIVDIEWEGQPAMLATLRDVSERIQLNEDLKQSNKDLEELRQYCPMTYVLRCGISTCLRDGYKKTMRLNLIRKHMRTSH